MYSYLTNHSKITGVPKSLLEINYEAKSINMIPVICSQDFLTHMHSFATDIEKIEKLKSKDMAKIYWFIYEDTWSISLSGTMNGMNNFLRIIRNNKPVLVLRKQKNKKIFQNVVFDRFVFIYVNRRSSVEQNFLREFKGRRGVKNEDGHSALADEPCIWEVIEHSVIFKILNNFIGRFDQSGIYKRDRIWLQVLKTMQDEKKMKGRKNDNEGATLNKFTFYFQDMVKVVRSRKFLEKRKPVSVETFIVLWAMLGVMTVVGSIIFVRELIQTIKPVSKISVNGIFHGNFK